MAEEVQYATGEKRKYEEQTTPPPPSGARRATGFSAPIASQSPDAPPASYNSVPPPALEGVELARQRALEIAARISKDADTKRVRVENGGGFDLGASIRGFSSGPTDLGQKPAFNVNHSVQASYGYPSTVKKIEIPNGRVGVIIGKGGETIKYLQVQSGAKIQVTRDVEADLMSPTRSVELTGTPEQIEKAEQLINDVLSEAESGGSGIVSRRVPGQPGGGENFVMKVPNNKVGLIIGKGGETIKNMQNSSGARIQVIPLHLPPGDTSTERTVQIDGSSEQVEAAKQLVNEVISEVSHEGLVSIGTFVTIPQHYFWYVMIAFDMLCATYCGNRLRNPAMAGGYSQQGYQARPPTSWAPSGQQMQQPGYGYMQPGAYPGPSPQYNMPQPPYGGYPPQQASAGYATGWDQNAAPPNQQQAAQGGSYDYYNQQQQAPVSSTAPTDNAAYGYNQPPASGYSQQGQGYTQDGYGAYPPQSSYGQSQPNPVPGYDQQGYNTASGGYGNVNNPTPEGHTPSYGAQGDATQAPPPVQASAVGGPQGYSAGQQPSPNPSYPPQASAQPGYGVPPTSQTGYGTQPPPAYGSNYGQPQVQKPPATQPAYGQQPQQSPTAQGGYAQPAYSHSQPPPAQSGYAQTAAPAYAPPPYGTAPVTQPSYGGQQQPPYNSSYGSGYSQPPVYSADGSTGGNAPAVQPSGVAKASPPS
ncbi:hypothetical protein RJ639_020051 [Escallonia herrerae]|uniref:K Homology domain-containing protein n=1 Tax=Escallonia herrerae TaxID=1293975 RepID=A0AA88VDM4_9ASTE|nr:hypothetical protein RJ639_020051 [Escallonia herrerae]